MAEAHEKGQLLQQEQEANFNIFGGNTTDSTGKEEASSERVVVHSADKDADDGWSFIELAEQAKRDQCDMVELLKGRISITEIAV